MATAPLGALGHKYFVLSGFGGSRGKAPSPQAPHFYTKVALAAAGGHHFQGHRPPEMLSDTREISDFAILISAHAHNHALIWLQTFISYAIPLAYQQIPVIMHVFS